MNELITVDKYCQLSKTALNFKREVTREEWQKVFDALNHIEGCVQFWIGDCLKYREQKWGMYNDIVEESGKSKQTLKDIKWVSDKVKPSCRQDDLSFEHHKQVASLEPAQQKELLQKAVDEELSVRDLRQEVRKIKHETKIVEMPEGKFNIIYADPPWEYEFSETSIRDVEKNYPTMKLEEIKSLEIPTAKDCVLFLWATAPKLREALEVIEAWGFEYKTHCIWDKEWIGMGYWFRGQHELLLIATKGNPGTPLKPVSSVYKEKRTEHSRKPNYYYNLIEDYFPKGKYLELFARKKHNDKWTTWGNE